MKKDPDATQMIRLDAPGRSASTAAPPVRASGRLVCVAGPDVGKSFRLGARPVVIGRGVEADVAIAGDDVSRKHARIEWRGDHFIVADAGSSNGTTVNGIPIREAELHAGDRITLGAGTILVFTHDDDLEHRALQLQKLESLAHLAGGVVHDFRNMLSVIVTNVDLLEHQVASGGDPAAIAAMLGDVREAARAGLDLTKRLLFFSRRNQSTDWATVDLTRLVDEATGLVARAFASARIDVELAVAPGLAVRGNAEELRQCLLNLLLNARDAMPDGGRLRVAAAARTYARIEAMREHLPYAGEYVEITVRDEGPGMDEAIAARVFEPFFTTKPAGQGTGLGLATVYGVVRNHGGNVLVDSAPGRGTTFRVLVPRWTGPA